MRQREKLLTAIYDRFLEKHGLPSWSADELLFELVGSRDIEMAKKDPICIWLDRFIHLWERCDLGAAAYTMTAR